MYYAERMINVHYHYLRYSGLNELRVDQTQDQLNYNSCFAVA